MLKPIEGAPASQAPREQKSGSPLRHSLQLFRVRCYVAISAAFFAFCSMLWIFYAWLPAFLYERYHLSMAESGQTLLSLEFDTPTRDQAVAVCENWKANPQKITVELTDLYEDGHPAGTEARIFLPHNYSITFSGDLITID